MRLPNLQGLVFKEQEVGYLVGYLAAKTRRPARSRPSAARRSRRSTASSPASRRARRPRTRTSSSLNGYSQDFVDQATCKEVALDQIAKGSDVVFQVAGGCGLGALDAAKEKSVWGIGVDADQAFLGDHILTSAVKRVDEAVFQTIEAAANGEFEGGGVTVFGLAEDGVGLGEISTEVTEEILDEIEELKQQIIDGEIEIPDTVA